MRSACPRRRDEILGQPRAALPVDLARFGLHGAVAADGREDRECELLARARDLAGLAP